MKIALRPCLSLWLTVLSVGNVSAQGKPATSIEASRISMKQSASSAQPATATVAQDPGERKFQANCSRCHNAPQQLSPRIAGTVVRHMRVRASLSTEDERDILRYLAP
jgi:cytochrome c5